ncbi:MAG: alpha/beta hydrolase [Treponema sp.]|nr:alpha/beta hydrolase [Treponema sp.]
MKNMVIILCLIFSGCAVFANKTYFYVFGRIEEVPDTEFHTYITWKDIDQNKYSRKNIYFNSGGNLLQGFIYGENNKNGLVVISQGLGNTADHYLQIIMYFIDKGWKVFSYNNTGVSGSEGDSVRGLTQSLFDLDAALAYINDLSELNDLPIMLVGHSWGGFAACAVLNYQWKINAVVSFAGFNNGNEVINNQGAIKIGGFFYLFSKEINDIEKKLFGGASELTAVGGINNAGIPVMIVQSSDDDVILAESTSIYAHRSSIVNPLAEIIFLDGENAAGHEFVFCSKAQREYVKWAYDSWNIYKSKNKNGSKKQWEEENNFDVFKANELNLELMDRINNFFENAKKTR